MLIHKNPLFSIYFGGAKDGLMPPYYLNLPDTPLLELSPFDGLKGLLGLKNLMFLHQTHSNQGLVVDQASLAASRPFKVEGDYLVTNLKHIGIGIMTADCLPILFYDRANNAVAAIHAGWRGSVLGIAAKALERMQEEYGTRSEDLAVFFGPSALACCYEVSRGFEANLEGFTPADNAQVLVERNNKLYFDVPLFNRLQLEAAGVKKDSISTEYNVCTMCNKALYSSRRDNSGRQMTVICLG